MKRSRRAVWDIFPIGCITERTWWRRKRIYRTNLNESWLWFLSNSFSSALTLILPSLAHSTPKCELPVFGAFIAFPEIDIEQSHRARFLFFDRWLLLAFANSMPHDKNNLLSASPSCVTSPKHADDDFSESLGVTWSGSGSQTILHCFSS